MPTIPIPSGALDQKLVDFGLLVGLLNQPDGKEFNLDWFENPLPYLKQIPGDARDMLNLLRDILGSPAKGTPSDREWYAVNWNGAPSGVYIVLPLKSDTNPPATVGVGLWHPFTADDATINITGWVFFPLFNLPDYLVLIYLGLDEKNQAFKWLERAYSERSTHLVWLKVDPIFDELRSDLRYTELMQRIGLPNVKLSRA